MSAKEMKLRKNDVTQSHKEHREKWNDSQTWKTNKNNEWLLIKDQGQTTARQGHDKWSVFLVLFVIPVPSCKWVSKYYMM